MTTQPTRSEFKTAVLSALTSMGGFTSDREALYAKVFEILKYDPSLMGQEEKSGRSRAGKTFNAVCFALRKEGKLICPKRGEYSLPTVKAQQPQPVPQQAKPQQSNVVAPDVPVPVEPQPQVQTVPQPQVAIEIDKTVGVSLNLPQYADWDNYLIDLATKGSSCFGTKYSTRSGVCKECPMARHCQAKRGHFLADLAKQLEAAVESDGFFITQGKSPETSKPEPAPKAQPDPTVKQAKVNNEHLVIEIMTEGIICEGCGGRIAKGANAVCIPGKGTFHTACVK